MPFSSTKILKYRSGMQRRIESLRNKAESSLEFAVDNMMQDRVDSFFRVEQGLEEVVRTLALIEEELPHVFELSNAIRLEARLEFIEDRWDDLDSEARERPRRRRRRINLADFLKAAGGGTGDLSGNRDGINNAADAYATLGLDFGSPLSDVTTAFRHRAKQLHPDARKGDRSSEPELRRILEAYQYLKEYLSLSNVEPPRRPDAEYRPTE